MLLLDRFVLCGYDMDDPTEHLLVLARNLMSVQGLSKVPIEEVLAADLNPFASYQQVSRGGSIYGQEEEDEEHQAELRG